MNTARTNRRHKAKATKRLAKWRTPAAAAERKRRARIRQVCRYIDAERALYASAPFRAFRDSAVVIADALLKPAVPFADQLRELELKDRAASDDRVDSMCFAMTFRPAPTTLRVMRVR